ncbi:MAG: hypothetical protein ABI675_21995 [Chitinophagaceae bacterium]
MKKARNKKGMNRAKRMQLAVNWIAEYKGKQIVKGYARKFKVDLPCAIIELRLCGVNIPVEYEEAFKRSLANRARQMAERKGREEMDLIKEEGPFIAGDAEFEVIAGYTTGGAPYGIRWEEVRDRDSDEYF